MSGVVSVPRYLNRHQELAARENAERQQFHEEIARHELGLGNGPLSPADEAKVKGAARQIKEDIWISKTRVSRTRGGKHGMLTLLGLPNDAPIDKQIAAGVYARLTPAGQRLQQANFFDQAVDVVLLGRELGFY